MAVGSFFGLRFLEKNGRLFRWFFRILKTHKSQSKHPKKKQIPQDVTSKWRIPPKIPRIKEQRCPRSLLRTHLLSWCLLPRSRLSLCREFLVIQIWGIFLKWSAWLPGLIFFPPKKKTHSNQSLASQNMLGDRWDLHSTNAIGAQETGTFLVFPAFCSNPWRGREKVWASKSCIKTLSKKTPTTTTTTSSLTPGSF